GGRELWRPEPRHVALAQGANLTPRKHLREWLRRAGGRIRCGLLARAATTSCRAADIRGRARAHRSCVPSRCARRPAGADPEFRPALRTAPRTRRSAARAADPSSADTPAAPQKIAYTNGASASTLA